MVGVSRPVGPRMRLVSRLVAAVLVTVVVSAPAAGARDGAGPGRVLVIGDSIILGTGDGIAANLPGWDVTFDATVSRSTAAGVDAVAAHGTDFDVVVVSLGANDGGSPGVFGPRVAAVLDALGGVDRVIWLTIAEARPYYADANTVIRDAVRARPNATVGDWATTIAAADTGSDGLHLTPQGAAHMSAWVAGLVRDGATAAAPTSTAPVTVASTTTSSTAPSTAASTTSTSTTTSIAPSTTGTSAATVVSGGADGSSGDDSSSGGAIALVSAGILGVGAVLAVGALRRRRRDRSGPMLQSGGGVAKLDGCTTEPPPTNNGT